MTTAIPDGVICAFVKDPDSNYDYQYELEQSKSHRNMMWNGAGKIGQKFAWVNYEHDLMRVTTIIGVLDPETRRPNWKTTAGKQPALVLSPEWHDYDIWEWQKKARKKDGSRYCENNQAFRHSQHNAFDWPFPRF